MALAMVFERSPFLMFRLRITLATLAVTRTLYGVLLTKSIPLHLDINRLGKTRLKPAQEGVNLRHGFGHFLDFCLD